METNHERAITETQWCLQEAYKLAVHHCGIVDWSKATPEDERQVELIQVHIAAMIQSKLHQFNS
jgi:hypothetical protein